VDSHVKIWNRTLQWVPEELWSVDHIGSTLQHTIQPVYWSEFNPVLASIGQFIQNPNSPIPDLLDAVQNVCLDLMPVFPWVLDAYGIEH